MSRSRVVANRRVGPAAHVIVTDGGAAFAGTCPGQFSMLRGDWARDPILPRAFSVLRVRGDEVEYLIKGVGRGTRLLCELAPGETLDALGPLGRPFPAPEAGRPDLLVAGGVGLAPLLFYAELARGLGLAAQTTLLYGARTAAELVLLDEIAAAGCTVIVTTEDGTRPAAPAASSFLVEPGRVTAPLARLLDEGAGARRLLSCGPNPMMRAVAAISAPRGVETLLSLEGEMACGIGACLGCAIPTASGQARPFRYCCVDGPVFDAAEIVVP